MNRVEVKPPDGGCLCSNGEQDRYQACGVGCVPWADDDLDIAVELRQEMQ